MITRETTNFSELDFQTGEVILIDKPIKWSSFKVIYEVRKVIGVKKVGHAGTLNPLATGLLIVCTGKKTKEITSFQDREKVYTGVITLGKSTPSMDTETEVELERSFEGITEEDIKSARDKFVGSIFQTPPMYSAVKYKGKSLYKLARKGKSVEREPREVTVYSFEIKKIDMPEVHFEIKCSKGTYIRVIANDFGNELGCGGVLSELRRIGIGQFRVGDALSVDEFKEKFSLNGEIIND